MSRIVFRDAQGNETTSDVPDSYAGGGFEEDPVLLSGSYAPVVTPVSNTDSTPVVASARYLRIGNIVFVSGMVSVDATASGDVQFKLSLPFADDLVAAGDLSGTIIAWAAAVISGGAITAAAGDNTALCRVNATSTSARDYTFNFSYAIDG